ncbi:MAG: SCO family protein [Turneriella sp.]|nr:SCO family protein [Turneriella sp.]
MLNANKLPLLAIAFLIACNGVELRELPLGLKPETELLAQSGRREKLMQALREANVLFFGYTQCPDFCPLALSRLHAAIAGDNALLAKIALLFVSVDPQETPASLTRYLAPYPYARGFCGSADEIAVMEKLFGAYSRKDADTISHSLYFYVLNNRGRVVYLLRHDDDAKKIRRVLRKTAGL